MADKAMVSLRQIRYFVKVVETGNMTRAADVLGVAQPALGTQIRQLEINLGVTLLERHSRGVVATAVGQRFYERAAKVLKLVEEAVKEATRGESGGRETITVGLTPGVMRLVGSDLLVAARSELPNVALSLVEEMSVQLTEAIARGELDFAFAYDVPHIPGLLRTPLFDEELVVLLLPDDGAADEKGPMQLEDVLQRDLVLSGGRDTIRNRVEAMVEKLSLDLTVTYQVHSIAAMKRLVAKGVAISVMPYGSAADELKSGALIARRIEPAIVRTLYCARPSGRAPFENEAAITVLFERLVDRLIEALGHLARRTPRRESRSSMAIAKGK